MKRQILVLGSLLVLTWDVLLGFCCRVLRLRFPSRKTVLVYHNISPSERSAFARQVAWMRSHCAPCNPETFLGPSAPTNAMLVTFDDAYEDIFHNAMPLLDNAAIPSLVFVPAGFIGEEPGWERRTKADICGPKVGSAATLRGASPHVTYGAHGHRHLLLTEASEQDAQIEVVTSKATLEHLLKRSVKFFAFPYGGYDSRHVDLCRRAGYLAAFAATPGSCRGNDFIIPRTSVSPSDTKLEFLLKIKGAYRWQSLLIRLKRSLKDLLPARTEPSKAALEAQ